MSLNPTTVAAWIAITRILFASGAELILAIATLIRGAGVSQSELDAAVARAKDVNELIQNLGKPPEKPSGPGSERR